MSRKPEEIWKRPCVDILESIWYSHGRYVTVAHVKLKQTKQEIQGPQSRGGQGARAPPIIFKIIMN